MYLIPMERILFLAASFFMLKLMNGNINQRQTERKENVLSKFTK